MKWTNVSLVYRRELRDQLRDRRTLFTVLVLPVLLYPLLGMVLSEISQFMRENPAKVWVVGYDSEMLPAASQTEVEDNGDAANKSLPRLIADDRFNETYCSPHEAELLTPTLSETLSTEVLEALQALAGAEDIGADTPEMAETRKTIQDALGERQADLLVYFPPGSIARMVDRVQNQSISDPTNASVPQIQIVANLSRSESGAAKTRFLRVLDPWRSDLVAATLDSKDLSLESIKAFNVDEYDISAPASKQARMWSMFLPFVMLIWALTGAFYPAIDACAGEKERGTLETLLCSPAARSEIVTGKLLNVMSFSALTSLLNLLSMMFTGLFFARGFTIAGSSLPINAPPMIALLWLCVALIPASALFGSLALAVAAFARSSKEGQYYLMPLLLVSLPLLMIAILPTTQMELGTSLIPLTGLMLLLRELIEGDYWIAAKFSLPVLLVTGVAVWLSTRWAVSQFNRESVIFRESEQVGVAMWLRHLIRDRGMLPSVGEALLCGILILLIRFLFGMLLPPPASWNDFATTTAITLLAFVATPPLLMALFLTKSPKRSLMLNWPGFKPLVAAIALAVCLHPTLMWVGHWVVKLYPISRELAAFEETLSMLFNDAPGIWAVVLLLAATPAICEEVAYRGFILSGLSGLKNKWAAIALSSVLFGVAHSILQQSITAAVTGCVLGYVAFQSRSLFPTMLYHFAHNGLSVLVDHSSKTNLVGQAWYSMVFRLEDAGGATAVSYQPLCAILMLLLGGVLLYWFSKQNRTHSLEPLDSSQVNRDVARINDIQTSPSQSPSG